MQEKLISLKPNQLIQVKKTTAVNRTDKIIIIFYVFLAISYPSVIIYMNQSIDILKRDEETKKIPVNEIKVVTKFTINKTNLFDTVADVRNYPIVSPDHFISVKIVNQSGNVIYAEEKVKEKLVTQTMLVKHTIIPYSTQTMEVMDGDAQGTIISANFTGSNSNLTITTDVQLKLKGNLALFASLPKQLFELELSSVVNDFAKYSAGFNDKNEKIVDDLYREILHRPADESGLKYWTPKLENGGFTVDDLRKAISDSPEAKSLNR